MKVLRPKEPTADSACRFGMRFLYLNRSHPLIASGRLRSGAFFVLSQSGCVEECLCLSAGTLRILFAYAMPAHDASKQAYLPLFSWDSAFSVRRTF